VPDPCVHIAFYLDGNLIPSENVCPAVLMIEGRVTFDISGMSLGHHTLTAAFAGSDQYYPT